MGTKKRKLAGTVIGVVGGNALIAFAVAAFIVPQGIIMGGATGIGLLLSRIIPLPLSMLVLTVNAALFIWGTIVLGKKFAVTTIASTFLYPAFLQAIQMIQMIPGITKLTDNIMLSALYGGVILGAGIGMIVRVGASTGGTDIFALIFNKWFHIPVAVLLYVVDFLVLGSQIFDSTSEQVLYGIITLVLETVFMNKIMLFGKAQIQVFIISEKYEEIKEKVLKDVDAGVTMFYIETGYDAKEQKGVMCVLQNRKLFAVRELVQSIDPKAFITVSQINEVSGRGFTLDRVYEKGGPQAEN